MGLEWERMGMYRFGLVGCGRISGKHVEALRVLEEEGRAKLVACCDVDRSRAENAAEVAGCGAFGSIDEMLEAVGCDVLSICTPSGLHPAHVEAAARHGCHALSEKPAGTSLDAVDRAIRACDEAGVMYFVVKQNRFNKPVELLRRALEGGRFGRIYMISSNVFWTRPQSYYDQAKWRGTWEFDGGALSNQASHYVDLMQWIGGSVESVQAFSATLGRRIEAEDTIVVNLRYRSGALGSLNVTTLTYPKNLEGSLTVIGERGTVKIGGVALNRIEHWEFECPDPMDEEVHCADTDPPSVYGYGHLPFYRHVLDVLDGKAEPMVTGREGRKTVEIIQRVYSFVWSTW
ncbi:MAG: Gfo/Idh/MocA family oxidoreductase [Thermanaerothrix sp.]|nr:Gfo/Idh/MocA family oxidoreductase [Thermanaerothrix sp.]